MQAGARPTAQRAQQALHTAQQALHREQQALVHRSGAAPTFFWQCSQKYALSPSSHSGFSRLPSDSAGGGGRGAAGQRGALLQRVHVQGASSRACSNNVRHKSNCTAAAGGSGRVGASSPCSERWPLTGTSTS